MSPAPKTRFMDYCVRLAVIIFIGCMSIGFIGLALHSVQNFIPPDLLGKYSNITVKFFTVNATTAKAIYSHQTVNQGMLGTLFAVLTLFMATLGLTGYMVYNKNKKLEEELTEKLKKCDQIIESSETIALAHMAGFQGSSAINAYDAAIDLYDKIIEIEELPAFYSLRSFSCQMRSQEGDLQRIIRDSNKALLLNENWGAAHFSKALAQISLCIGEAEEEQENEKKVSEKQEKQLNLKRLYNPYSATDNPPKDWQCCFNTGEIFLKLEDRPYIYDDGREKILKQIDTLKVAHSHNVPSKTVHVEIAKAYKHIENYEKALKFYKSAYEANSTTDSPLATNAPIAAVNYCKFWAKCLDFADEKQNQLEVRKDKTKKNFHEDSIDAFESFISVKNELEKSINNRDESEYGTISEIIKILEKPQLCQSDQKEYLYSLRLYLLSISQSEVLSINEKLQSELKQKLDEYPPNAFSSISLMTLKDLFDSTPEEEKDDENKVDS